MKKYFKLILLLNIIFMFGIKGVKAETVTMSTSYIDNVWSFHYRNGDIWSYGQLPFRYANDKLVYCLQPDVRISTSEYILYDFNRSGYSEEDRRQMELISYYGYRYNGHDSINYYIATQDLLWRFSPDDDIKWTTSNNINGEVIDISNEKNEILSLVSKHNILPSFNNSTSEVLTNNTIELYDDNDVLSNYDLEYDDNLLIEKDNNTIKITPTKEGEYKVKLKHKINYNSGTYIYDNFNTLTQMVGIFGAPTLIDGEFSINAKNSNINIYKKDKDSKELIYDKGITIKIKNIDTDTYVGEYEFIDGLININLPVGKYLIEEITTSDRYKLNDGLEFEVDEDNENIDFYNEKVIMPITSTTKDYSIIFLLLFDILGYVYIKKIN